MWHIEHNKIIIDAKEPFDARKIAVSGQLFRAHSRDNSYVFYSGDKRCVVSRCNNRAIIESDVESLAYFIDYFDITTSYHTLNATLRRVKIPLLSEAVRYGSGLRIIRQNYFEALISFIISSNNNIARIQKIITSLCTSLGVKKDDFYAFPSAEAMAARNTAFYEKHGCGYRAPWLCKAAKIAAKNNVLEDIAALPTPQLLDALQEFDGVGPKVADCVALFAYHRFDVFPVDTWIKKIYTHLFGASPSAQIMRRHLIETFGHNAGLAQQYLFYYYRTRGK